jgi:hypothetical protein
MPRSRRWIIAISIVIIFFIIRFFALKPPRQKLRGDYVGQTPPNATPTIFAPNFISDQFNERDATFSPDGSEFYYTLWTGAFGVILHTKQSDAIWSQPEVAPFSSQFSDLEPFVTHDGARLYFASNRPLRGDETKDYDIFYVQRESEAWSKPIHLDSTINQAGNEFYPTLTKNGTLYFTAQRKDGFGGEDIYRSQFIDGSLQKPENLGPAINSARGEFNAFVAPDESFIIFSSFGRPDGLGGGDLYISFYVEGAWTNAINLGDSINSPQLDYCPSLSPDGSFFFFTSRRRLFDFQPIDNYRLDELYELLSQYGNGYDDIYWMKSDFIASFRQRALNEQKK